MSEQAAQFPTWELTNVLLTLQQTIVYAAPGEYMYLDVNVQNNGGYLLVSGGSYPVMMSYHIYDAEGDTVVFDGVRTPIEGALIPGEARNIKVNVYIPSELAMREKYVVRIEPVAESLFWFEDVSADFCCDVELHTEAGFKPMPVTFEILRTSIKLNCPDSIVTVEGMALRVTNGKAKAGMKYAIDDCELPEYLDFIEIHVDGFEYQVLKGAEKTINRFKPAIYTETFGNNRDAIMSLMESYGYYDAFELKPDYYLFVHNESSTENKGLRQFISELNPVCFRRGLQAVNRLRIEQNIAQFFSWGLLFEPRAPRVIVSLTSFPARMSDMHYALYSLLNQTVKPDKLILWLGEEAFPGRENDLPDSVLSLKARGLTVAWCRDIRSYTKIIPTLREFPDDIIVTADDDIYYPSDWLEKLYNSWLQEPAYIHCHRCHRIRLERGRPLPYKQWDYQTGIKDASYLNFFTGVGGVLYPPHILPLDTLKEELFMKLTPDNDDIWLWAMAVCTKAKIRHVDGHITSLVYVNADREKRITGEHILGTINVDGNRNDFQLEEVIKYFDFEILDALQSECPEGLSV